MTASGYLQLLQKGAVSGEQLKPTVDTVERNVNQIVLLVNDILFLQEMDLVLSEFQPVDMGEISRTVIDKYKTRAADKKVTLTLRGDQRIPTIPGDARSLERALMALVDNAIKFSPHGGDVEIHLRAEREKLVVFVEDHGIGIDLQNAREKTATGSLTNTYDVQHMNEGRHDGMHTMLPLQ